MPALSPAGAPSRRGALSCLSALVGACAMSSGAARALEPPTWPALTCTVIGQSFDGTLRLQVRFDNSGTAPVELPTGPHLVLYTDPGATDALETTARLDRVQRTPLTVPAGGSRIELFAVDTALAGAMRCPSRAVQAAGLNFYRFSPRPQSRCVLAGYDPAAMAAIAPCPGGGRPASP